MFCNLIPFLVILTYIGVIGGPLVSILGAYSNRVPLFHIFCKKKYRFGKKIISPGEQYLEMTYLLLKNEIEMANDIWKMFDKSSFIREYSDEHLNLNINKIK